MSSKSRTSRRTLTSRSRKGTRSRKGKSSRVRGGVSGGVRGGAHTRTRTRTRTKSKRRSKSPPRTRGSKPKVTKAPIQSNTLAAAFESIPGTLKPPVDSPKTITQASSTMSMTELQLMAKSRGIPFGGLNKTRLINKINNYL